MSTTAMVSVQEYIATSYRPDRDFVDGELQERNLGELEHSLLQGAIAAWFWRTANNGRFWGWWSSGSRLRRLVSEFPM